MLDLNDQTIHGARVMEIMTMDRLGEIEASAHKGIAPSAATTLAEKG